MLGKVDGGGVIPSLPIVTCNGATREAKLKGYNVIGMNPNPTVDVFVNNILIAADIDATYINQSWYLDSLLSDNASEVGYNVSGTSSNEEVFYNSSNINITFGFVPKSDGFYNGQTYSAKDALKIHSSNTNPTVYKDPATGVVTFCLKNDLN